MSSNLADLPLDLLADQSPQYWHLMINMSSNLAGLPLDLPSYLPPGTYILCQDEFKFGRSTPRSAGRSIPSQYWHLKVRMSLNLADLPLDLLADLTPGTNISWSRWFQIWQIYPPGTEISQSRWVPIWQIYPFGSDISQSWWGQIGRSTPRSAGWSILPSTDILWSRWVQIWQIYPVGSDISQWCWGQIWQIYP